jgi:DNA repair protein RadA/Sms
LIEKTVEDRTIIFGEIGLGGEVRPVSRGQERVNEAKKLGFTRIILPEKNIPKKPIDGVTLVSVKTVKEAMSAALNY